MTSQISEAKHDVHTVGCWWLVVRSIQIRGPMLLREADGWKNLHTRFCFHSASWGEAKDYGPVERRAIFVSSRCHQRYFMILAWGRLTGENPPRLWRSLFVPWRVSSYWRLTTGVMAVLLTTLGMRCIAYCFALCLYRRIFLEGLWWSLFRLESKTQLFKFCDLGFLWAEGDVSFSRLCSSSVLSSTKVCQIDSICFFNAM